MRETDPREVRFGYIAVEKGFVKPSQVIAALEMQFIEDLKLKKHRILGEILIAEGHITPSQVKEVFEGLEKEIPDLV